MSNSYFRPSWPAAILFSLLCGVGRGGQDDGPLRAIGVPGSGTSYRQAVEFFEAGQYERTLRVCSLAIDDDQSDRIFNRFQALAVRCCLRLNRRDEALRRCELIWQRDPTSPDLCLVPLVWDSRVPPQERCAVSSDELESSSPLRQLAAASSLLQNADDSGRCVSVITAIRAKRQPPLTVLAEAQLWRVKAPQTDEIPLQVVLRWQRQAATLSRSLRPGPQYVVGRAFQVRHKPDTAVPLLLWAPLMMADDPILAASGLAEAIVCLEASGRSESAGRLRQELRQRYGHTSAARRVLDAEDDPQTSASAVTDQEQSDAANGID